MRGQLDTWPLILVKELQNPLYRRLAGWLAGWSMEPFWRFWGRKTDMKIHIRFIVEKSIINILVKE
jgi:hypothetical protein